MWYTLGMSNICPECGKPVGGNYPGAKVYHMACLEARFKPLREKWEKESEEKRRRLREAYESNPSN